jgi:hypothetical protein
MELFEGKWIEVLVTRRVAISELEKLRDKKRQFSFQAPEMSPRTRQFFEKK